MYFQNVLRYDNAENPEFEHVILNASDKEVTKTLVKDPTATATVQYIENCQVVQEVPYVPGEVTALILEASVGTFIG